MRLEPESNFASCWLWESQLEYFALAPGSYHVEVRYSSGVRRARDISVAAVPVRGVIDRQTPKVE